MVEVVIGQRDGEHVVVEILTPAGSAQHDGSGGTWLTCRVSVCAGAFSGSFRCNLTDKDFSGFLDAVRTLNKTLKGEANLYSDERQLNLTIRTVGSLGGLEVTGVVVDVAGTGNRLTFRLAQYDQTQLLTLDRDLETLIASM